MIYSVSLSVPCKKAFEKETRQSSVNRIMQLVNDDPEVSGMDTVVLGPRDGTGPKGRQLAEAIKSGHPGICFIYIYNKDKEEGIFDVENKVRLKRVNASNLREAVEGFLTNHTIQTGRARVGSADFIAPDEVPEFDLDLDIESEETPEYVPPVRNNGPTFAVPKEEEENVSSDFSEKDESIPMPDFESEDFSEEAPTLDEIPLASGNIKESPTVVDMPRLSMEEAIQNVRTTADWDVYKASLNRDSIYRRLIEENSQFQGLINVIDTLDFKINAVWQDPSLPAETKFDKIKEIGLDRSVATATANSIMTTKVIDIISKVALSAKRTVDDKLESYNKSMYKVASAKMQITDVSQIEHAIEERVKLQMELLALSRKIIDLYNMVDTLVSTSIQELDAKLPSSNEFINNMVRPIGTQIFTPTNTAELANAMLKALEENRLVASMMENHVNALVQTMFELFSKDSEVINYQANYINMLRAHHVEDAVIVDSVIKNMLRIFTGAPGTGCSATTITWCGILSRRQNCLLIDLTGKAKFIEYGITPITLDDFMRNRVKQQFLCVQASGIPSPDELQAIIEEMKTRLDYYPYVNVIMDPEDIIGIEQAAVDALSINYICNCTSSSMDIICKSASALKYENIGRKVIMIDPPISPLSIADRMLIDPSIYKLVVLPNMPELRACAIQHDRPYEYEQVIRVFEEAFR